MASKIVLVKAMVVAVVVVDQTDFVVVVDQRGSAVADQTDFVVVVDQTGLAAVVVVAPMEQMVAGGSWKTVFAEIPLVVADSLAVSASPDIPVVMVVHRVVYFAGKLLVAVAPALEYSQMEKASPSLEVFS